MSGKIARSWELIKQSFRVLAADKRMVLFPVLSAIAVVVVSASFLLPVVATGMFNHHGQPITNAEYGVLLLFYFANYFVIVFFNSALVYSASICLSGGHATLRDGLSGAWSRIGQILAWAAVAATVGMILRILEERLGRAGRIVTWLLGTAWTLMTYFIVPVLVFEDMGIVDSIKHSAGVLKKTWGEEVISGFSFGLIWLALMVPGVVLAIAAMLVHPLLGITLGVLYILILAVISAAVKTIFTVALYRYASQGTVPSGFTPELVQHAFVNR
jgi:hypothetical protein